VNAVSDGLELLGGPSFEDVDANERHENLSLLAGAESLPEARFVSAPSPA
jgi:hypothetical protein